MKAKKPKLPQDKTFVIRSVALPKLDDARLNEWCELNERSRSFGIARAVKEFLDRADRTPPRD